MGRPLNRKEVADFFGCSLPTVDVWVKEGCPAVQEGAKGSPWQFDSVAVHGWLVKKARAERRTRGNRFGGGDAEPPEGDGLETSEEGKARKIRADASIAELELATKLNFVAPVATIAKVLSAEIANARARILAIPTKVRPVAQMHAKDDERSKKIVSEVDRLIREALEEIKAGGQPVEVEKKT
jgi:phage terminase Nu1 subunit (DNA packaging protein)